MANKKTKPYQVVRTNLNSQVYSILKEMIADQRFNPGSYINVEQLTHELNVSRTPVWEAIRRLEQEGIVVHTPHKGVRVQELTRELAIELYEVREALECMAARLGAERTTPKIIAQMEKCLKEQGPIVEQKDDIAYSRSDYEFHLLICEASGNELLKEMMETLRYKARPMSFRITDKLGEFLNFHKEILDAFRKRDGMAAEDAIRRHNRRVLELIRADPWDTTTE